MLRIWFSIRRSNLIPIDSKASHLQALDFDELFEPVNDEELVGLVVTGDVTGVKPAVDDRLLGGLLVAVVPLHDLRPGHAELTILKRILVFKGKLVKAPVFPLHTNRTLRVLGSNPTN